MLTPSVIDADSDTIGIDAVCWWGISLSRGGPDASVINADFASDSLSSLGRPRPFPVAGSKSRTARSSQAPSP